MRIARRRTQSEWMKLDGLLLVCFSAWTCLRTWHSWHEGFCATCSQGRVQRLPIKSEILIKRSLHNAADYRSALRRVGAAAVPILQGVMPQPHRRRPLAVSSVPSGPSLAQKAYLPGGLEAAAPRFIFGAEAGTGSQARVFGPSPGALCPKAGRKTTRTLPCVGPRPPPRPGETQPSRQSARPQS